MPWRAAEQLHALPCDEDQDDQHDERDRPSPPEPRDPRLRGLELELELTLELVDLVAGGTGGHAAASSSVAVGGSRGSRPARRSGDDPAGSVLALGRHRL